ncbi:MAG: M28 family peptidase [Firmicutes bacterium]|jgi:N-acetylated-alpha-linked acidic dipeptidase|nr:M28 family peptidase [Bacillota bacterium]
MNEETICQEKQFLEKVTGNVAWPLVEQFATLNRESGSIDEKKASDYIVEKCRAAGVPVTLYNPKLYLSLPRETKVKVGGEEPVELVGKTPAFSVSTGDTGITGKLVYLPSQFAQGGGDLFDSLLEGEGHVDLTGTIVLTEGFPLPQKMKDVQEKGAVAAVFIHPGERIHEMICTPIWGAPDLDNKDQRPTLAVASVNRSDGEKLIAAAKKAQAAGNELAVTVITNLEEGLYTCPLPVVTIQGNGDTEEFVLLHGHLDSWHYGIGDNAVGCGAMLELALALYEHRDRLKRSVRIAWWPGHSTGRYAGSTWYADQFGVELAENCVAQVNCDSPGCRWATVFEEVSWTAELAGFTQQVIKDMTGLSSTGERPPRAGDWSFNNLGISGTLMLSSTIPDDLRKEKGYYGVGGCGGNIEWHTEADTLEVADKELLIRDMKVYGALIWRLATMEVLPLDFRATIADMHAALGEYATAAKGHFDLNPVEDELQKLNACLDNLMARSDISATALNQALVKLSRILMPLHFARDGQFRQDPALQVPPLPDLAAANQIAGLPEGSLDHYFALTSLIRGRNRVIYGLREAQLIVEELLGTVGK